MNVKSCTVNPSSIALGAQANLTVEIDSAAPPGGVSVAIDTNFDGSQSTLLNTPIALDFLAGESTFNYLLQTQIVANPSTRIIFSAHIGIGVVKAAQLNIS
jgi:hypothetical protein